MRLSTTDTPLITLILALSLFETATANGGPGWGWGSWLSSVLQSHAPPKTDPTQAVTTLEESLTATITNTIAITRSNQVHTTNTTSSTTPPTLPASDVITTTISSIHVPGQLSAAGVSPVGTVSYSPLNHVAVTPYFGVGAVSCCPERPDADASVPTTKHSGLVSPDADISVESQNRVFPSISASVMHLVSEAVYDSVAPSAEMQPVPSGNPAYALTTSSISVASVPSSYSIPTLQVAPTRTVVSTLTLTSTLTLVSTLAPNRTSSSTAAGPSFSPHYRGFNVVNQSPLRPGQLKNVTEWDEAFRRIKLLPGQFNAVRTYSTTDGDHKYLPDILSMAHNHNLSVHVGVWSGGDLHTDRFAAEKAALDEALAQYGCEDIVAVSVGNEDMYYSHRTDGPQVPLADVMLLVNQTREVRDVLRSRGCNDVRVTHTDTFGDWLNVNFSKSLIEEVDMLTVNIFPFWEDVPLTNATSVFWKHVDETRVLAAQHQKEIWIGETGWPVSGTQPKVNNKMLVGNISTNSLQTYWNEVGCPLMALMNAFWYVEWDFDNTDKLAFGLFNIDGTSIIDNIGCYNAH